jgi:type VI protein secretion system component Hcp
VSSISHGGGAGDPVPTENVSCSYGAVSEQYSQQGPRGGLGDTVFAGWNATTGQLIAAYPNPCGGV